jgi:hypothetical protein
MLSTIAGTSSLGFLKTGQLSNLLPLDLRKLVLLASLLALGLSVDCEVAKCGPKKLFFSGHKKKFGSTCRALVTLMDPFLMS